MILYLLLVLGAALGHALPRQKLSTPSPYHTVDETTEMSMVAGSYVVELHAGYTLEEHFDFVGQNLSVTSDKFDSMMLINMYCLDVDDSTMHHVIRFDPGVRQVFHNIAVNTREPLSFPNHDTNSTEENQSLEKPWSEQGSIRHVSTAMLNNWDKVEPGEFQHTVSKSAAQMGYSADREK
jgi:hypothetical protein